MAKRGGKITANSTWGKIKNWDLLSPKHRDLLNQKLNPIYKEIEPRKFEPKIQDYFIQKNNTIKA